MSTDAIEIHTSDVIAFRRCRRKWMWQSHLREGLRPNREQGVQVPLWFGSGFHYALEDYHGVRKNPDPATAFQEYTEKVDNPDNLDEHLDLASGMFQHYLRWQKYREKFYTLVHEGRPLVEVDFRFPLPEEHVGHPNVWYAGTMDRIVKDDFGDIYVMDYKTARAFDEYKLEMDLQISAYMLATKLCLDVTPVGFLYLQFRKEYPRPPKLLKNGRLSVNKAQNTNIYEFEKMAKQVASSAWRMDPEYREYAEYLEKSEQEFKDKYIMLSKVYRSDIHLANTYWQLVDTAKEMLNPDLSLYPNPNHWCSSDCSFRAPCLALDDGSDPDYILENGYYHEDIAERHAWRDRLNLEVVKLEAPNDRTP